MTKEELTIDLVKGAMASSEGLGSLTEGELRAGIKELVRISLIVADETFKILYTQGNE